MLVGVSTNRRDIRGRCRNHAKTVTPSQTGRFCHQYALVSLKPPPITTARAGDRTATLPALEVPTVSKHFQDHIFSERLWGQRNPLWECLSHAYKWPLRKMLEISAEMDDSDFWVCTPSASFSRGCAGLLGQAERKMNHPTSVVGCSLFFFFYCWIDIRLSHLVK